MGDMILDIHGSPLMHRSKLVRQVKPYPIHFTWMEAVKFFEDPRFEEILASWAAHSVGAKETDEVWYYDDMGMLCGSRGYVVLRDGQYVGHKHTMRG